MIYKNKKLEKLLKDRPSFLVDKHLIKAAKKAAKVFEQEEEELRGSAQP